MLSGAKIEINSQNGNYFLKLFLNFEKPLWLGHCPDEFIKVAGARWLKPNGPAVEGVSVTRRSHPDTLGTRLSRWRDG